MNNNIAANILAAATYPMSATALAQKVGKSKGYMIQDELDELVNNGSLIADDSGRYTMYKAASRVSVNNNGRTNAQQSVVADVAVQTRQEIPAGYSVSKSLKRKSDGKKGRIITLPTSTNSNPQRYFVESGYSLVVINGEAQKCVQTPTSTINVIQEYANAHGMSAFAVSQSSVGTIGKFEDIASFSGIIDLTVKPVNKAAL